MHVLYNYSYSREVLVAILSAGADPKGGGGGGATKYSGQFILEKLLLQKGGPPRSAPDLMQLNLSRNIIYAMFLPQEVAAHFSNDQA